MDYSISDICSAHESIEISLCLKPVQVPYFTSMQVRSPTDTIFERTYSDYSVTNDFIKILSLPGLKIELLDLGGLVFNQDEFFSRIIKALKENGLKIHAETVHFHNTNKELTTKHVELLRNFDEEVLYGIEINTRISDDALQEMIETEQWKKAKKLTMFHCKNVTNIDNLLHFEKMFLIDFPKLATEDAWKLIQSYRNRNIPSGSFFDISGTEIEINKVIETFDVPVKCEELDSEYVKHIQHFQLEDGYVLEVRLYEDKILSRKGKKEDLGNFW